MRQANQEKTERRIYTKGVKISASGRRTNKERLTADRQEARKVMSTKQRSEAERKLRKQLREDLKGVANNVHAIRQALLDDDYWKASCEADTLVAMSTMTREGVEKLEALNADESVVS